jgi:cystathionine beta-lyase
MKRVQTIHLGYALVSNSWREAIVKHVKERYLVEVTKDQLVDTLGIVQFVHICMDMFTKVGDGVLLLTPSYFPVYIKAAGRKCYESKLVEKDKRFWINFEEVEAQLSKPDVRILILVSPHNPCGRIWSLI